MLLLFSMALCVGFVAASEPSYVPYSSYTYSFWGKAEPAPHAYVPQQVITGSELGIGRWSNPLDVCVSESGRVYVLDTGNNRIVCLDDSWHVDRVIDSFENEGRLDTFHSPQGISVGFDGLIYVADTGGRRVVVLQEDGRFIREVGPPESNAEGVVTEGFVYEPVKVEVDPLGRMYVIAKDVYEGLLVFDKDGEFQGFVGAPRVRPTVADLFWRRFSTVEQRARQSLFIPIEFRSMDVDSRGLVFAVTQGPATAESIKRLNPAGNDVLTRRAVHPPIGDLEYPLDFEDATVVGPSVFGDIATHPYGLYSVLDTNRGRVFTYDSGGHLLYVFGGLGNMEGLFTKPVALDYSGNNIVVLDSSSSRLTVFSPTQYASIILAAKGLYEIGRYDAATAMWRKVLHCNEYYDQAYIGIGKSLLRQDEYQQAMDHFRKGNYRSGYSEAFSDYRREVVESHFGSMMFIVMGSALVLYLVRRMRCPKSGAGEAEPTRGERLPDTQSRSAWTRLRDELSYSLHVVFHPFDGFWDLKYEERGSVLAGVVILIGVILSYIFMRQYTGFIHNPRDVSQFSIVKESINVLLPFVLWVVVSWALTTLMDGKGTLADIFITTAYALVPIILICVPLTVASHFITADEGAIYQLFVVLAIAWCTALVFIGTMVVHHYSGVKTAITLGATLTGIAFTLFMGLVFVNVVYTVVKFVTGIYAEVSFRL